MLGRHLTQLQQIEREMSSGGFLITYFAAGIFGCVTVMGSFETTVLRDSSNVLGGNFARAGVPSVGASGAIFGTVAVSRVAH